MIDYDEWGAMGRLLQMDDGEVFYVEKGEGTPVIMVHFYGGNSWWYCRVLDTFAQRYKVYALDLPGFGRSEEPPLPYTVPDMADALKEFMDRLHIDTAHLLGIGGGAMTLVHLASSWPSRVQKLALEVLPHWSRSEGKRLWVDKFRHMVDDDELPIPMAQWPQNLRQSFPGLTRDQRSIAIRRMDEDFSEHGRWWVTLLKVGQLRYDTNLRLHLIQAPTLLVNGETAGEHLRRREDAVTRAIKGSRLEIIARSDFPSFFQQPELYSELVLDFLETRV